MASDRTLERVRRYSRSFLKGACGGVVAGVLLIGLILTVAEVLS